VSGNCLVLWDKGATAYDFGPGHPMRPLGLELPMALAGELSLFDAPGVLVAAAGPADAEQLASVHTAAYIEEVRRASVGVAARASGFCVCNDGALAAVELLAAGARRVAYVDLDAHHGDGVQHAFYADPRVLTISLHESGLTLWPGIGFPGDSGAGDARGMSVNVALPGGTGDAGWLRALTAVVPPLLQAYEPQVLITQLGCDGHRLDTMSDLELSVDGMRAAYGILHRLAHEVASGRWLVLGGGYEPIRVVPRAWCHALSEVVGVPLPPAAPTGWVAAAQAFTCRPVLASLHDHQEIRSEPWRWGAGNPSQAVDRAIMATRRAVFPEHGLDVMAEGGDV
jgi:acetoin utilization protein AcuC